MDSIYVFAILASILLADYIFLKWINKKQQKENK